MTETIETIYTSKHYIIIVYIPYIYTPLYIYIPIPTHIKKCIYTLGK